MDGGLDHLVISIHALAWSATGHPDKDTMDKLHFNPRTRMECDGNFKQIICLFFDNFTNYILFPDEFLLVF